LILFKVSYEKIYYLSLTRCLKPEPKLQIPAPTSFDGSQEHWVEEK
jgi:hypothetical protein